MRVLLVGAPGSLKNETWRYLQNDYKYWGYNINLPDVLGSSEAPALGALADYRTELLIAAHRAHVRDYKDVEVYLNSLIDSLAYATVRLAYNVADPISDEQTERLLLTEMVIGAFVRDTLSYDLVFLFPGYDGEEGDFNHQLSVFYPQLLDALEIEHTVLDAEVTENAVLLVDAVADAVTATQ